MFFDSPKKKRNHLQSTPTRYWRVKAKKREVALSIKIREGRIRVTDCTHEYHGTNCTMGQCLSSKISDRIRGRGLMQMDLSFEWGETDCDAASLPVRRQSFSASTINER